MLGKLTVYAHRLKKKKDISKQTERQKKREKHQDRETKRAMKGLWNIEKDVSLHVYKVNETG